MPGSRLRQRRSVGVFGGGTADAEVPAGKSALLDLQPFRGLPDAAPHGPGAPRVGACMRGRRATNNSVPIVTELERTSESDFGLRCQRQRVISDVWISTRSCSRLM